MWLRTSWVACGFLLALAVPALGATQQDYAACQQTTDLEKSIDACTRIVADQTESAADRVGAYLLRAYAYLATDKLAEAIADYGAALALDPQNVSAYINRAVAYVRKNDRDHAVADYRQAVRLDHAKATELAAAIPELKDIAAVEVAHAAEAETPAPAAPAPATEIKVVIAARKGWQSAGLTVHGQGALRFSAAGTWTFNPSLPAVDAAGDSRFSTQGRVGYAFKGPGGREGQLIGRIGYGEPFVVGTASRHKIKSDETGPVYLVINDDLVGAAGKGLTDNKGHLTVTVREDPE